MRFLPADIKVFTMGKVAFWVGFLLSSAVGLLFFVTTANTIERDAKARFNTMARSVQNMINERVKSYNDVLRGSASLFQATPNLTRKQFHLYVQGLSLEKEFPGIDAINFVRTVTEVELPAFEAKVRQEIAAEPSGYPPFQINPPGRRAVYDVITYIEPIERWSSRFGVDISGNNDRGRAQARDSGELSARGIPIPFLSGPTRTALSMRLPIYRATMPISTLEERRTAYLGSVGVGFSVQKLLQGVLGQMPVRGARLALADVGRRPNSSQPGASSSPRVLFDSSATATLPSPSPARPDSMTFVTTLPIYYTTRLWEFRLSIRKSSLYTGFDAYVPWLAMLAGFVSMMLLFILFQTLSSSSRTAVALAESMTKELRHSEAKLQRSNDSLRRLGAHADKIKEAERKRIAREIHDDLGQNLLALRIEADMLLLRTGDRHPHLHMRARATVSQIDATIKSVRQIINDLRPSVLDLGLNAAVDWQIAEFQRRTGINCDVVETHQDIQVSEHCATALFRILQESLSNILRHAHATRVQVVLRVERGWILMSVGDNGVGFHPKGRYKLGSFGLIGIEERINILGGTFDMHSESGSGTIIRVAVPIPDVLQHPIPLSNPINKLEQGTALV